MFVQGRTRKEAEKKYPQAFKIVRVCGGFMVFNTADDYSIWESQK
jgi:hypothetical protein